MVIMKVQTAIIPLGGAGTRLFPGTTAIEKCMMPVYAGEQTRPIIDFMVESCARAGIKRVLFVASERGKVQLKEYFEEVNPNLQKQLTWLGREDKLEAEVARRRSFGLVYDYILQGTDRYGTAYPLFRAKDYLKGESRFVVMGGDDFVYRQDGTSELTAAIEGWDKAGTDHGIIGIRVPRVDGPKYGILQTDNRGRLVQIDEKPPLARVPASPIANISRYLLSDAIWLHVVAEMAQDRGNKEHYITYPINNALKDGQTFQAYPVEGEYMDGGSFEGLLKASQYLSTHPVSRTP
jgi:glucose-1-phosphate adenylyltransferase